MNAKNDTLRKFVQMVDSGDIRMTPDMFDKFMGLTPVAQHMYVNEKIRNIKHTRRKDGSSRDNGSSTKRVR